MMQFNPGSHREQSRGESRREAPSPPPLSSSALLLEPSQYAIFQARQRFYLAILAQGIAQNPVEFVGCFHDIFSVKAESLSLRTCRARKMRPRTAASEMPKTSAICGELNSFIAERTSG